MTGNYETAGLEIGAEVNSWGGVAYQNDHELIGNLLSAPEFHHGAITQSTECDHRATDLCKWHYLEVLSQPLPSEVAAVLLTPRGDMDRVGRPGVLAICDSGGVSNRNPCKVGLLLDPCQSVDPNKRHPSSAPGSEEDAFV